MLQPQKCAKRRLASKHDMHCMLQGTFQLHWPLINSDHMRVRLAQRELEQKRIEDGNRCLWHPLHLPSHTHMAVLYRGPDAQDRHRQFMGQKQDTQGGGESQRRLPTA